MLVAIDLETGDSEIDEGEYSGRCADSFDLDTTRGRDAPMDDTCLDCLLFGAGLFAGLVLAAFVLMSAAMLGELVASCFGRWRKWVVVPLTVLASVLVTYALFGVLVELPQKGVIPWWVSGCIVVVIALGEIVLGVWAIFSAE